MGKQLDRIGRKFPLTLIILAITGLSLIVSIQRPENLEQVEFIAITNLITLLIETVKKPLSKDDQGAAQDDNETKS